jgi:hypothetical protein
METNCNAAMLQCCNAAMQAKELVLFLLCDLRLDSKSDDLTAKRCEGATRQNAILHSACGLRDVSLKLGRMCAWYCEYL